MSRFYTSPGREYTIALSATYSVKVYGDAMMYEAESIAWNALETILKEADVNKYEIYETMDIQPTFLVEGYNVKIKVNFEIYVVSTNMDDAFDEAVGLVEGIVLPENMMLLETEQTDLAQVGDLIMIAHGDDV